MSRRLAEPLRASRAGHLLVLIPLGFIVAISVTDILSGPDVHLGPLLVVAPAITASFAGAWLTAVVGGLAVLAQVFIGAFHGGLTTENHEVQIAALVVVTAVIVLYCRLRERHEGQLHRVRSVSDALQHAVLRPLPHGIGPLRVAVAYMAAEDEARVGGDLYAATRAGPVTRLVIGDVRGKGLDAIGDSTLVLGAFRELAHQHASLPALAAALESSFCREVVEAGESEGAAAERFVTAVLLDVPDVEPVVRVVNCGHPPPLLVRGGRVSALQPVDPAPPLGMCGLSHVRGAEESHAFGPGDLLLLYTDGVTEARNGGRAFYPLAERVAAWPGSGPQELVDWLRADLLAYVGGQLGDDAVLIALERTSG